MNILLKMVIAIICFFVVPELLGLLPLRIIKKEKNNFLLALVLGYIIEFAICQIFAVPYIYMEKTLTELVATVSTVSLILSLISFILSVIRIKEIFKSILEWIKEIPKVLSIIFLILLVMQIYGYIGYAHIDDDDYYYVGTSTVSVQTDTLYKYSAATGAENEENMAIRYRIGPFPLYSAIISKIIDIHPAIVSHVIIPIIFVPLVYLVFMGIANELFEKDKKSVCYFLIILCIFNIFGNYSIRTRSTFLLIRLWQGKAILANLMIPLVIYLFIKAKKEDFKFNYLLLIFITILAGNFTTTMGIALPPLTLMLMSIVSEANKLLKKEDGNKRFLEITKNFVKCLGCCIPSIFYGILYFFVL